jgi:hypothetical protein
MGKKQKCENKRFLGLIFKNRVLGAKWHFDKLT